MFVHQTNKTKALYGVVPVSAAACFQGSLITQFALNIIPPPFHIISSIKYAEFTSSTQV
jgi:hypothetical protein